MEQNEFSSRVAEGARDEYVSDDLLQFLRDSAEFEVIEKSALQKDEIDQSELISVALDSKLEQSDAELIETVKTKLTDGSRDAQKYQLRHNGVAATKIQIWRHDYGYSAFGLSG